MQKQLVLKNILSKDEWLDIKNKIKFDFNIDNHYAELKESEVLQNRLNILQSIESYSGRYFSDSWIRKNVLMHTEEEIKKIDSEIKSEKSNQDETSGDEDSFMTQNNNDEQGELNKTSSNDSPIDLDSFDSDEYI